MVLVGLFRIVQANFRSCECIDSNGAEIYAMLMGCCELSKLEGYNAIIEGDSFSAI